MIAQKDLNALRVRYGHNQRNDFFRDTGSSANAPVSHFYEKRPPHKAMYSSPSRLRSKLPSIIFQELRGSEQGRPSIIYAMVGVLIFSQFMSLGKTLLAASLTLVILTLPTIIRTTQESLKTVPQSYREGSLGLGSGKWHMIRTVVLPNSIDGIVTGCILAVGRIVGESAVLMFTAGMSTTLNRFFVWNGDLGASLAQTWLGLTQSSGATLTVALYVFAKERAQFDIAFAIGAILMIITLLINLCAKLVGKKLKK